MLVLVGGLNPKPRQGQAKLASPGQLEGPLGPSLLALVGTQRKLGVFERQCMRWVQVFEDQNAMASSL